MAETKAFAMGAIDIWRVADGRLIEHWDEPDTLDIFTRIGAEARLGQPPACGDPKNWPYGDRPMQLGKPFAIGLPGALGIVMVRGRGQLRWPLIDPQRP